MRKDKELSPPLMCKILLESFAPFIKALLYVKKLKEKEKEYTFNSGISISPDEGKTALDKDSWKYYSLGGLFVEKAIKSFYECAGKSAPKFLRGGNFWDTAIRKRTKRRSRNW